MQTNIRILAACFNARAELSERSFRVIQRLEYMNYHRVQVCNDYDCPLLSLTTVFHCVPSHCISHSVSAVHVCSSTCTFRTIESTIIFEREHVRSQKLVFVHDISKFLCPQCVLYASILLVIVLFHFNYHCSSIYCVPIIIYQCFSYNLLQLTTKLK